MGIQRRFNKSMNGVYREKGKRFVLRLFVIDSTGWFFVFINSTGCRGGRIEKRTYTTNVVMGSEIV